MQHSVNIVLNSDHPTSKVAATIIGKDTNNQEYVISHINHWPDIIRDKIGTEIRIGNASGTIHAETNCILNAPHTEGAALYITDPPCPNCVKNMAEAGITELYVDHKGFDKDFARRRSDDFETMSMRICKKSGIAVYVVFRKESRVEMIFEPPGNYKPAIENPTIIEAYSQSNFEGVTELFKNKFNNLPMACALVKNAAGEQKIIGASTHPVAGYTSVTMDENEGKYSYILQPLNRIMMNTARYGLKLDEDYIFSSRVPTSRELVNFIGAGFKKLHIGDTSQSRDPDALQALKQLQNAGILECELN